MFFFFFGGGGEGEKAEADEKKFLPGTRNTYLIASTDSSDPANKSKLDSVREPEIGSQNLSDPDARPGFKFRSRRKFRH